MEYSDMHGVDKANSGKMILPFSVVPDVIADVGGLV